MGRDSGRALLTRRSVQPLQNVEASEPCLRDLDIRIKVAKDAACSKLASDRSRRSLNMATKTRKTSPIETGARGKKLSGGVQAYEDLKSLILSGELRPGADLDEGELVRRFSVSRTPVREALIRLSMEGLVTMKPSRGAKVSNLNYSDIADHLEVMDILTPSVCYLAALRRTSDDLESIRAYVDRLNANRRQDVRERLDSIYHLHTSLGTATHNHSLAEIYRLAIYAKLRIGRMRRFSD